MSQQSLSLAPFYKGWDVYQQLLVAAIAPLTPEQLVLRPAPHIWSIGILTAHIISTRVWWFHRWMGVGSAELDPLEMWDEEGAPARLVSELVAGLESTWKMIQDALASWTPNDLEQICHEPGNYAKQHSRQWIIWHLLEHDLHHGGEISLILGMHGLTALDL